MEVMARDWSTTGKELLEAIPREITEKDVSFNLLA
jgi:hypothetical protein